MMHCDTYSLVIEILNSIGIFVDIEATDIDLTEYAIDSLSFITFIIELEKHFYIELPDDCLVLNNYKSLKGFCQIINELIIDNKIHLNESNISES